MSLPDKDWDPEAALAKLVFEQQQIEERTQTEINEAIMAEAMMRSNLPLAAEVLTHIMLYAQKDDLRLKAATYVMDRGLGKVPTASEAGDKAEVDPIANLLAKCVVDVARKELARETTLPAIEVTAEEAEGAA